MSRLEDACPDGEHIRTWLGNAPVCSRCGLSTQTLRDWLGHTQWEGGVR